MDKSDKDAKKAYNNIHKELKKYIMKKERYTYFKINIKDLNKLSSSDPKIKKRSEKEKNYFLLHLDQVNFCEFNRDVNLIPL